MRGAARKHNRDERPPFESNAPDVTYRIGLATGVIIEMIAKTPQMAIRMAIVQQPILRYWITGIAATGERVIAFLGDCSACEQIILDRLDDRPVRGDAGGILCGECCISRVPPPWNQKHPPTEPIQT